MEISDKTPLVQNENKYIRGEDGRYPLKSSIHKDLMEGHCEPSDNNQKWSPTGYWVKVPRSNIPTIKTQNEIKTYKSGRIETCTDNEGNRKKILSSREDSNNLVVWYDIKDIQESFPKWTIPESTEYENKMKFDIPKIPQEIVHKYQNNQNLQNPQNIQTVHQRVSG